MKSKVVLSLLVACTITSTDCRVAWSLDFKTHSGNRSNSLNAILATGEIVAGDTQKLAAFLSALPPRKNTAIYLASPGGNLVEGMTLGLFFKANHIKSVVEGGQDCASACAIAFLGGTDNQGNPWRSSSTTSRLGFHAFSEGDSTQPSTDEVQQVVSEMLAYGQTVRAPIELFIAGFATSSKDIYWANNENICALKIKLWSVEQSKFVCD